MPHYRVHEGKVVLDLLGQRPQQIIDDAANQCFIVKDPEPPLTYILLQTLVIPTANHPGDLREIARMQPQGRGKTALDRVLLSLQEQALTVMVPEPLPPPSPPPAKEPLDLTDSTTAALVNYVNSQLMKEGLTPEFIDLIDLRYGFTPVLARVGQEWNPNRVVCGTSGLYTVYYEANGEQGFETASREVLQVMRARYMLRRTWLNEHMHQLPYDERNRAIAEFFGGHWLDMTRFKS